MIASWNNRAKYYVITEPGKKGIQDRTNVGEPPPAGCTLKGCTGDEWLEYSGEMEVTIHDEADDISKKKESERQHDSLSTIERNDDKLDKKEDWFSSIFGG